MWGRELLAHARWVAVEQGLLRLELETRIELTENHEAFAKLGFVKIAERSHVGHQRVTAIAMRAGL